MEVLRKFYELTREVYGPVFPTSEKKKKEFMDEVRQKVDYYKPRIEERCKISLRDVKVKDNREWLSDLLSETAYIRAIENAWEAGKVPTEIDYRFSFLGASVIESLMVTPIWLYNSLSGTDFRQYDDTIYVPFYYINRFMDMDFKRRINGLDYGVVHELSHVLWDRINKNKDGPFGEWRKWFEGFATYCADDYFADFYSGETEKRFDLPKVYTDGKKRIEELIKGNGKGILLEVPRKWKEFSNISK